MKRGTVALVINRSGSTAEFLDALTDDQEILKFETYQAMGETNPLVKIYEERMQVQEQDEEFGDYVEELVSKPFIRDDIRNHALKWLKSKIQMEEHHKREREATQVIASYALEIFKTDTQRREFILSGAQAQVQIKVFEIQDQRMVDSGS